jgi:hypothetical protein
MIVAVPTVVGNGEFMSDAEKLVRQRWPDVEESHDPLYGVWEVYVMHYSPGRSTLGVGPTREAAYVDAARKL